MYFEASGNGRVEQIYSVGPTQSISLRMQMELLHFPDYPFPGNIWWYETISRPCR